MADITQQEAAEFIRNLNLMTLRLMGAMAYFEELRTAGQKPPQKVLDLYSSAKLGFVRYLAQIEAPADLKAPIFEMPAAVWSPRASQRVVKTISNAAFVEKLKGAYPQVFATGESLGDAESAALGVGAVLAGIAIVGLAPAAALTAPVIIVVALGAALAVTAAVVTRPMIEDAKGARQDSDLLAQLMADCRAGNCPENAEQVIDLLKARADERKKRSESWFKGIADALKQSKVPLIVGGVAVVAVIYRNEIKALLPAPKSTTAPVLAGSIGGSF